jgi:immunity protein 52 of polymorphic toxin system
MRGSYTTPQSSRKQSTEVLLHTARGPTMSSLVFHACWGSRLESPDGCALHLGEMLRRLAVVHPVFGRWRRKAKTKAAAQGPFCSMPPDSLELRDIIEKTGERHITGTPLPELGYRFYARNELDEDHSLSFSCRPGRLDNKITEPNSIDFSFGRETPGNRDLLNYSVLKECLSR